MKKTVTYILIFIVSFAHNIETVKYLLKAMGDSSIVFADNFQCDEKDLEEKESEKSNDEKKYILHDYILNHPHFTFYIAERKIFSFAPNKTFFSTDYCQEVYSPPEV